MKPPTRIALAGATSAATARPGASILLPRRHASSLMFIPAISATAAGRTSSSMLHVQNRSLHSSRSTPAKVHPISGTGPPPAPPVAASAGADAEAGVGRVPGGGKTDTAASYGSAVEARIGKKKAQAELLKNIQDMRDYATGSRSRSSCGGGSRGSAVTGGSSNKKSQGQRKRFYKDVHVREVGDAYEIHLDSRPLRDPTHKKVIRLPLSKPQLAYALAVEWDSLETVQQAGRQHLIPLTSLICRALDIRADDNAAATAAAASAGPVREAIATSLLRYLDTDSLLCWAPASTGLDAEGVVDPEKTLRKTQERVATPIVAYLTSRVWPGVTLEPVLDDGGLLPKPQADGVRDVVRGWLLGLGEWDLAGVERAVLAGKGLLVAARLVAEWSEGEGVVAPAAAASVSAGSAGVEEGRASVFGVEDAARATSVEVDWQTGRWGEVEDTHDVEKEDIRRQLGSVVLLVSGDGSGR